MDKILLALAELKAECKSAFTGKPAAAAAADDPAIKSLETQLAATSSLLSVATADLAARDATVATLTADLADAKAASVTSAASVADLTTKLATETKRVDETMAALGVDPKTIPAAPAPPASTNKNNWTERCRQALRTAPARA